MEIPVAISDKMEESKIDDNLLRMSAAFREFSGYDIDEFINFRSDKDNELMTLRVAQAYKEDLESDPAIAYVSPNTFGRMRKRAVRDAGREIEVEIVEGITLGCDPEFFLISGNDEIVPPNIFFRRWGYLGYDGRMVELRPAPSTNEEVVAYNLYSLIQTARATISSVKTIGLYYRQIYTNQIKMIAASFYRGSSAGFHLHYGLPAPLLGKRPHNQELLARQIIKALDFYVGIPSVILEGSDDYQRRVYPNRYGKPGEFNLDNRTLEYRVPGGHLLRHPKLTIGLLGTGAVVVEDLVSRMKKRTDQFVNLNFMIPDEALNSLYPNVPDRDEIYKAIVNIDPTVAESHMKTIMEDIRCMVGYEKRKKSVEGFLDSVMSKEKFSNDMEINWGNYYYERQQRQMDVFQSQGN